MAARIVRFILIVGCLWWGACDRKPQPVPGSRPISKPTATQPQVQWVDPNTIQRGPIIRDSLTPEQMDRVRKLQAVFAGIDGQTVEQWVDDFKRDLDPDRELGVWEVMAKAYTSYCSDRSLSPEAKREVFKIVLLRSAAPEQDVLEHLELKMLSRKDAIEVMRGF
jgi:hypothetical protein